jgi:hypothetical protein
MSVAGCTSRSRGGLRCDRPGHPDDPRHFNELAGVEWFERRVSATPTEQLLALEELHGWRGQGELALGVAGDDQAHAVPTRSRR